MTDREEIQIETTSVFSISKRRKSLKVGYVPMLDCASLIVAKEMGFFERAGLNVELSREVGWATIRERILHGELDASHAHGSMVYELNLGLCGRSTSCLTGVVMSLNGSALSLSNALWEMGVRDAPSFRRVIVDHVKQRKFRLAVVMKFCTQNYLLRQWLLDGGIDPDRDVEIVVVPTPQVLFCLLKGHIDGFCAGEPWGSLGILEGISWCIALTGQIKAMHPEKVLLVRSDLEQTRHEEHVLMIQALLESAEYCDRRENRHQLAELLSMSCYFDLSKESLLNGLVGPFQTGRPNQSIDEDVVLFSGQDATRPTENKARWILDQINLHTSPPERIHLSREHVQSFFRMDLYEEAEQLLKTA